MERKSLPIIRTSSEKNLVFTSANKDYGASEAVEILQKKNKTKNKHLNCPKLK